MSKRYVIQVNVGGTEDTGLNGQWSNVQHPKGGDWLCRARSSAIADAAKLVNAGETRELRVAVSRPVYEVTPVEDAGNEAIRTAAQALVANEPVFETDDVTSNAPKTVKYTNPDGSITEFEI